MEAIVMNEAVARMLERYDCRSLADHLQALREILQEIALLGLWRSKFFDKARPLFMAAAPFVSFTASIDFRRIWIFRYFLRLLISIYLPIWPRSKRNLLRLASMSG